MLKSDLLRFIKTKFAAGLPFRKYFGYDGNVFHIFIQEMFNFSKISPHQIEVSKESKKTCEESSCMLKTTFMHYIFYFEEGFTHLVFLFVFLLFIWSLVFYYLILNAFILHSTLRQTYACMLHRLIDQGHIVSNSV